MENQATFQDYEELQAEDLNNIQLYAQQSFDDIVNAAVTASIRYFGFNTTINGTAEIAVAPGLFFGPNTNGEVGAVYALPVTSDISLVEFLAVSEQRYVTLTAFGVVDQTNQQARNFVTNTQTGQTQPQTVTMESSRVAVLQIVQGSESASPTPPAVPTSQVSVANILLSNTGIVSITMLPAGQVTSTESLNTRLEVVEAFDAEVLPDISALTSNIAALQAELNGLANMDLLVSVIKDVARLKALEGLPSAYSQYGATYFLYPDSTQYDTTNSQSLGWNCKIDYGIHFPDQNAASAQLSLFNPLDPNAEFNVSSGLLLPSYITVLSLGPAAVAGVPFVGFGTVSFGQYTYQTQSTTQVDIPYTRIRYGAEFSPPLTATNAYQGTPSTQSSAWWLPASIYGSFPSDSAALAASSEHQVSYTEYLLVDYWDEPYWVVDVTTSSVNGAFIAQTWQAPADMWIDYVGVWINSLADTSSAGNITCFLCECTNGVPDLSKVLATGTINVAGSNPSPSGQGTYNVLTPGCNPAAIPPTYVQKGTWLAAVFTCSANQVLGKCKAGSYTNGTMFYSLNGEFFFADPTSELILEVWQCQFDNPQVTIQLDTLNLAGGIRSIDIAAQMQVPESCQLVFETNESGSAVWNPISENPNNPVIPFNDAPVLLQLRARMVGSIDVMPGIVLSGSLCTISCPGPTLKFISEPEPLTSPQNQITLQMIAQNYNPAAHTITPSIWCPKAASGTVAFTTNPSNTQTLSFNGTTVTFVTSGATGNQVNIGGSLSATLTALLSFLQASTDANLDKGIYALSGNTLNVYWGVAGTAGNGVALTTTVSGATASGTLSGGSATVLFQHTASATTTTLVPDGTGTTYQVTASFTGISATSQFTIEIDGTTNSVADTFVIASLLWWAL